MDLRLLFVRYRLCQSRLEPPVKPGQEPRRIFRWEASLGEKKIASVGLTGKPTENGFQWWIHTLEVRPELRGRGIGSKLTRKVLAFAKKQGCKTLYLTVDPHTAPDAVQIYSRLGFSDTGVRDKIQRLIQMKKDL